MSYERLVTAKSLILDVLRASSSMGWPVSKLIEFAALFGVSENSIRVTLSRLVTRELIETDVRGRYRLSSSAEPMGEWIDFWMQGEARVRAWNGNWLGLLPPNSIRKREWTKLDTAAGRFGFRLVQNRYWVRPDNLAMQTDAVLDLISASSGISDITSLAICSAADRSGSIDFTGLWNRRSLETSYRKCEKLLVQSLQRFPENGSYDNLSALKESFLLGGHAINILAVDPLLPDTMVNVDLRAKLTATMLEYNEYFQSTWLDFFNTQEITKLPRNNIIKAEILQEMK